MKFIFIIFLYSFYGLINCNDDEQFCAIPTKQLQQNCTIINNSFREFLKRKKRSAIFPQDGAVLLTISLGKALLSGYPRGLVMSIELDSYTPLPDTVDKWKPTILINKYRGKDEHHKVVVLPHTTTTTHQPELHHQQYEDHHIHDDHDIHDQYEDHHQFEDHHQHENYNNHLIHNHHNSPELSMITHNQTLSRFDQMPLYYDHHKNSQKFWLNRPNLNWHKLYYNKNYENNYKKYRKNHNKNKFIPWINLDRKKFKIPEIRRHYKLPTKNIQQQKTSSKKYGFNYHKSPNFTKRKYIGHNNEWIYHRGHRERREIYNEFEKIGFLLGINMKSCILRAICEAKHFLLPKGFSLIHDLLRIVFTIPYKDHWNDDYSNAAKIKDSNCRKRFAKNCPISILEFFIFNERII